MVHPGGPGAQAGVPEERWMTARSEHFIIHYPAGLERVADRALVIAERSLVRLSRELGHKPKAMIHIRMVENVDSANGSANATPYPHINLFATAPRGMSSLGSYDDWLDVLVTHELVHVIHLDMVRGLPKLANRVLGLGGLGTYWSPQHMLPRWVIEGIATYEESHMTARGRHRYALFDMFLRLAVHQGRRPTVAQLSHNVPVFPYGTGYYLYGLQFCHDVAARYGLEPLRNFFWRYGGRVLPFSMNRDAKAVFGVDFDQLWAEFERNMQDRFKAQLRAIRARGVRQGRRITMTSSPAATGRQIAEPLWSADDSYIYFYSDDGHEIASIQKITPQGAAIREGRGLGIEGASVGSEVVLSRLDSATSFDFIDPAGRRLVISSGRKFENRQNWNDLFIVDTKTRHFEALTNGARSHDPDLSPDGRTIAFVRNDGGQSRLAFMDLTSKSIRELAPVSDSQEVFEPSFDPSGRYVAFSMWLPGGYRDLYLFDRQEEKVERLTASRYIDAAPAFSPDGKTIYFSSDRGGVFNIFSLDLASKKLFQVTNVIGGAFYPAVSHDHSKLAYVGGSANGYDLWVMPLNQKPWPAANEMTSVYPIATEWSDQAIEREGRATREATRYRAYKTLYPRTIAPQSLSFESTKDYRALILKLNARDAAEIHSWEADLRFTSLSWVPNIGFNYRTSFFAPNLWVNLGRGVYVQEGFRRPVAPDDQEGGEGYFKNKFLSRATSGAIGISGRVQVSSVARVGWSGSYRLSHFKNLSLGDLNVDPNGPGINRRREGFSGSVSAGLYYDDRRAGAFSFTHESGQRLSLRVSVAQPWLGGRDQAIESSATIQRYFRMPWLDHHVLALRVAGAVTSRGASGFGNFSLGGVGGQNDLLSAILQQTPLNLTGTLRGYPPALRRGRFYTLLNAEYRFPLLPIETGKSTLVLYASHLEGILFTDWGNAFDSFEKPGKMLGSLGGAIKIDMRKGYGYSLQFLLQYAQGLDKTLGQKSFRFVLGGGF